VLSSAQISEVQMSAAELKDAAKKIRDLRQAATEHAIEIGRELLRVKEKLPHGIFVKWVEKACDFKIRTAQDLMKLAREADTDAHAKLAALMVPSTLRVFLSKKTSPTVREAILKRLENGERVSRNDLYSQASSERRARAGSDVHPVREGFSSSFFAPEIQGAGADRRGTPGGDRSRVVAELLLRRLSPHEYAQIMDGLNWEIWNRVFVWMKAARVVDSERVELALSTGAPVPTLEVISAKLQ